MLCYAQSRIKRYAPLLSCLERLQEQLKTGSRHTRLFALDDATPSIGIMRTEAGRDPHDRGLQDLVGELSTRSEEFRTRWAAHDVRLHRSGTKHFRHRAVGDLHLAFDALELPGDAALTLTAYSAEPGTLAADNLALLASWAATGDRVQDGASEGVPPQ